MVRGRGRPCGDLGARDGQPPRAAAVALGLVAMLSGGACGGVPEACLEAARTLAPAAIAFVDDLPAGIAAVPPEEVRAEVDERDGRTLDQVLLEMNRFGLGGIDPAPGQDPGEVRAALDQAREAGCEVGDLRPTLAAAFEDAAASANGDAAQRYEVIARALRPE